MVEEREVDGRVESVEALRVGSECELWVDRL